MGNDKFLKYVKNPLSSRSMNILYSANGIKFDRSSLYKDFILSMLHLIFDTYMGDDITSEGQQLNHFDWVWNKNIENFKLEGINFKPHKKLYQYFKEFTEDTFYLKSKDNYVELTNRIMKAWNTMFDLNAPKSKTDVDDFIELYKLFEESLILEKKLH